MSCESSQGQIACPASALCREEMQQTKEKQHVQEIRGFGFLVELCIKIIEQGKFQQVIS